MCIGFSQQAVFCVFFSTNKTSYRYTSTFPSCHALLLNHTLKTLRRSTLVCHISRERQEVAVGCIGSHHVQIEVLESVTRIHLPHAIVRHLHKQLLRPRLVVRAVMLLLAGQGTLVILCSLHSSPCLTQSRLLLLHGLPVGTLCTANAHRDLVPQPA